MKTMALAFVAIFVVAFSAHFLLEEYEFSRQKGTSADSVRLN